MEPSYSTIREVAALLGVSRQRVHTALRARGITPAVVLGRLVLTPAQVAQLRAPLPLGRRPRSADVTVTQEIG